MVEQIKRSVAAGAFLFAPFTPDEKQECIPVRYVTHAAVAVRRGGLHQAPPRPGTPPPEPDLPRPALPQDQAPPRSRHPLPGPGTPPEEAASPVDRMTDMCKT